jgi:hypothetical protein
MFYPKAKSKVSGADKLAAQAREARAMAAGRARDATSAAAQTAQAATQTAAQAASTAAQSAAEKASESVMKGVFSVRGWAAHQMESAADYTTGTVAPKVSSVLRDTARQISPPNGRKKGFLPAHRWSLLATAAFAAAGAAALLVRQRYRASMAADAEDDGSAVPEQPASAVGAEPATSAGSAPADEPANAEVNGKISASG